VTVAQRGGIRIDRSVTERECFGATHMQIGRTDHHAGQQANQFEQTGREARFVEVVDVEINKTVIGFLAAEIFQMHVAANPRRGRRFQHTAVRQTLIEKMTRTA
jgi:hypothetical protein